jgi:hypothetical protein
MKKLILYPFIALASFASIAQDSFTSSIGAGYSYSKNIDNLSVLGSYYFSPVNNGKGPLAEAVFLNRVNAISASFNRVEVEGPFGSEFSNNAWGLGGVYHIDSTGVFLNLATSQANGADFASYSLGAGYYLSNDWTVSANTNFDQDLSYRGFGVSTKKLIDLQGDDALNLGASISVPKSGENAYALNADYYFNAHLSVGVSRSWASGFSGGTTGVLLTWFPTSSVSVSLGYARADIENVTNNSLALSANTRF